MYFFDSSALVKLFVAEPGSTQMIALVEGADDRDKSASALAALEVRSAIRRRERAGEISAPDAAFALETLLAEGRRYIEHPLSQSVCQAATQLLDNQPLRALDALQLATALLIQADLPTGRALTFVCCDARLTHAAAAYRLTTFDPTEGMR